ncbi:MAG TPA: hypothetical protein VG604_04655 [Candidatus Saccharimonadales bacterium]|nr:hypothetical protein [Candidatus Saccharimonadales bacterium]
MKTIDVNEVFASERIALPKGENNEAFRQAFAAYVDFDIPTLSDPRRLSIKSEGREFYWLRGIDIPEKVERGLVDAAVMGTDALLNYKNYEALRSRTIGDPVCKFSVLTAPEDVEKFDELFRKRERRYALPMVWLPTSRPEALERISRWRDLPFRAYDLAISGSVEAYARMVPGNRAAVADLVKEGNTAQANGLAEAMKLFDVSPEVVMRGAK